MALLESATVANTVSMRPPEKLDYSLTGKNAAQAVELGLAEADWYQSPVHPNRLRALLKRKNFPAIRDTIIWFALLVGCAWATTVLWGTWWAVLPYMIYAVFYATASDSRWHECSHGTAFKSDALNNIVYEISSFMVMRESVIWRWSHTRHHSDTIIVGRDPEIQIPRPPDIKSFFMSFFNLQNYKAYFASLLRHSLGRMTEEEKTFVPDNEYKKVFRNARIIVFIHLIVFALTLYLQSWLPLLFIVFPHLFGTWLMIIHNTTQHAGLAENVLDHRLNCRTVYMNPISRFIYWNMNYHLEHHMYPLVPYHALKKLHKEIIDDTPPPYKSIYSSWKELFPAMLRQQKDPTYHVKRKLPERKNSSFSLEDNETKIVLDTNPGEDGWLKVCPASKLLAEEILRLDHSPSKKTYALSRLKNGKLHLTDGICTHGNSHLAEGYIKGEMIECPKHNGRFNLNDGSPARAPVCRGLATYPVREVSGHIEVNFLHPGGDGAKTENKYAFKLIKNDNVATFIKEFVLELQGEPKFDFEAGDYLQFEIPAFEEIKFSDFNIEAPYREVWSKQHVFDLKVENKNSSKRNNYSIAKWDPKTKQISLNVRIATPPPGQDCPPGVGSSYMFSLKPGDTIDAYGPYGDFHIKPTKKEMIYIGGGAGMAPLRAHISKLLESQKSDRKISFWYGARSLQELFYKGYFENLAKENSNFSFDFALSQALEEDQWQGKSGFIHDVVDEYCLKSHSRPKEVEYYLCGPPMMISACTKMLKKYGVPKSQIAFDAF